MPIKRDSLAVILDRVYANYISLFKPLDKTPRMSLLKVFSSVDAGMYHQLLGDIEFLSRQLFPDTAEGAFLREHWSSRVTPLYATGAAGEIIVTGTAGKTIPAGVVFQSQSGERYYTESAHQIESGGSVIIHVKAEGQGLHTNLAGGAELSIVSSIPQGIDSKAVAGNGGITGGANSESDEEYLARVLIALRNPTRYGKKDDFAAWARDASPEVSAAWEFKNFGVFGALLIQVINGTQIDGASPVGGLDGITAYINEYAPPVIFTVRSPQIIHINPALTLPAQEDTQTNRELAVSRIKTYMQMTARPGGLTTAGALKTAIIDGVQITDATVKIGGSVIGTVPTTILEYPYIGDVTWE
jgi:uncharacterized phage protein gp47/JayE